MNNYSITEIFPNGKTFVKYWWKKPVIGLKLYLNEFCEEGGPNMDEYLEYEIVEMTEDGSTIYYEKVK